MGGSRCPTHFTTVFIPMATRLVLFSACSTLASSSQVDLEALASVCEGGACVGGEEASLLQVLISKHEGPAVANGAEPTDDTEAETTVACTADDYKTWVTSPFGEYYPAECTTRYFMENHSFPPYMGCLNWLNFSTGCTQCVVEESNSTMDSCQAECPTASGWDSDRCLLCVTWSLELACK